MRRRFVAGCVAFFGVMLAIAAISLLVWRDASWALAVLLPLAATYLASSAWLTATIVLMRSTKGPALTAWAGGGAVLLVGFFAVIVAARGA